MEKPKMTDILIADQARMILKDVEKLSKDPYTQIAALKSAAAIVQSRLEAAGVKTMMTAALTNVLKPQY